MTEPAIHRAWRVTEPIFAMIFFVPEATERYAALGLDAATGYFASRGGALGAVGAEPVIATFYSFAPALVTRALPAAWQKTTPEAVRAARLDAADAALRRGLGDAVISPEVAEAATLARAAAQEATRFPYGRALFAGHTTQPWPDAPHLVLWHAQMLLREFRGDGHVAALLLAGLSGLEAMVVQVASGSIDGGFLRATRGWRRGDWDAAAESLRGRGLLDGDELTEAGASLHARVEATTDELAEPAYRALGPDGLARLAELTRPLSRTLVKAGMMTPRSWNPAR
jgi:hypothetical protein